jgi:hypothetical protein
MNGNLRCRLKMADVAIFDLLSLRPFPTFAIFKVGLRPEPIFLSPPI